MLPPWTWPPPREVVGFCEGACGVKAANLKHCFVREELPKRVERPSLQKHPEAAHCCLFARLGDGRRAAVMMQMRGDGMVGFPGGVIDDGDDVSVEHGLNREMVEEINLDQAEFEVDREDFLCCVYKPSSLESCEEESHELRHLYAKEVDAEDFEGIERRSLDARDYGTESLGQIRVPLLTSEGTEGLKRFLTNRFAGPAVKAQLFWALYAKKILTFEELKSAFST